ncbi:hypothetical protein [Streptomyces sp. NPDC007083]|uniref:hypothetical protein n=1 Tax=Streptomyces sp. NPDC007083 TaxID=3156913 RepID=UPI0033DAB8B3
MADMPAEPRRLRWSVPRVDVSTNRWLDMQNDISRSLQLLIRESIQRDGYIDVVNRPVEQLPRRGRPPADAAETAAQVRPPRAETENSDRAGADLSDDKSHQDVVKGAEALDLQHDPTTEHEVHGGSGEATDEAVEPPTKNDKSQRSGASAAGAAIDHLLGL